MKGRQSPVSSTTPAPQLDGAPASNEDSIIIVRGLVKRYGTTIAVDGVDLTVQRNEIFGILGPNGAGKTTTLEMIEGLRDADAGSIILAGIDATRDKVALKKTIGVQLQSTALFDYLTIAELIELFAALYDADTSGSRVDELIEMVSLQEKRSARVDQLSGGQKQRLSIALAMVNDPEVLFLDEPTTGLDPQARRNLWEVVRSLRDAGTTIVLTSHYMEEAEELCDRVAVMDHGKIIACDTPLALVQQLGQSATVRASFTGRLAPGQLSALPGVLDAHISLDQLTLQTNDVPATLGSLFELARELGLELDNLTSTSATLEDVFLTYTGRSLRE
jgi:ABC-2 type transport system ATP-binding protein